MRKLFFIIIILFPGKLLAQSVGVGTTTPDASAELHIESTSKELLIPRVTTVEMQAITTPANGLLVFNTSDSSFYFHRNSGWISINSRADGWSTTGNAGTDTSYNFIGTTDLNAIAFKVNNKKAGFIEDTILPNKANIAFGVGSMQTNTTGKQNTSLGSQAAANNITGSSNVAIGYKALNLNRYKNNIVAIGDSVLMNNGIGASFADDASYNTGVGSKAMMNNTSGAANTALGYNALYSNYYGYHNTAIGFFSLRLNQNSLANTAIGSYSMDSSLAGDQNTAVGFYSLYRNNGGFNNVAIGINALSENTTGNYGVAAGYRALFNNRSGNNNIALGPFALGANSTGYSNIAIGYMAMYNNSSQNNIIAIGDSALMHNGGGATAAEAIDNIGIGSKALYLNTTGRRCTALGYQALDSNTAGHENMAIGWKALHRNIIGYYNTAVGTSAGEVSTGNSNLFLGHYAGLGLVGGNYNIFIGEGAGAYIDHGSYNIIIGTHASTEHGTANNKLFIDNRISVDSSTSFIYGDMLNDSLRFNAKLDVTGYTRLGKREEAAPAIKMKKLTGVTPSSQGAFNFVATGLIQSKILSITALATLPGGYEILPNHIQANYEYTLNLDNGDVAIGTVAGSSAAILNMPVVILVTYEE